MKKFKYIRSIIIKAGKLIDGSDINVNDKNVNDCVTNKDVEVERYLIDKISKKFPSDKFISEEINPDEKLLSGRYWIIDPIDGTTNFANGIKNYAIQIALVDDGDVIFSSIYNPTNDDFFYALKGKGSFLNNKRIKTSAQTILNKTIGTLPDFKSKRENLMYIFERLYDKVSRIQIHSSAAFDFSLLAKGSTSFHIIAKKKIWDYLPGYFLASQAGAVFKEIPLSIDSSITLIIVASNEEILNKVIGYIEK